MQQLLVEQRGLLNRALSWDLAHHMYTRQFEGTIVIVSERPSVMLATVCKQWHKVIREVQRERASTIRAARIRELTIELAHMQKLAFAACLPTHDPTANIHIVTLEELLKQPPHCMTLYVTCNVSKSTLESATQQMPEGALAVTY